MMIKKSKQGRGNLLAIIHIFGIFLILALSGLLFPDDAFAYIDPGTGSFLIQILFGFALTAIVSIKMFFADLKAKWKKMFSKNSDKQG